MQWVVKSDAITHPARWADSHTTAAPGKVGGFPHGSGAGPVGFRRIGVLPNALTRRKKPLGGGLIKQKTRSRRVICSVACDASRASGIQRGEILLLAC